jgi:hypothetical protein
MRGAAGNHREAWRCGALELWHPMQFKVTSAYYDEASKYLVYTATGERDGARYTVSSRVKCLKPPNTPERLHMVVLLALTDQFKRPSPSGKRG